GSTVRSQASQTYCECGPPYTHTTVGAGVPSAAGLPLYSATWRGVTPSAAGTVSRSGTANPARRGSVDGSCNEISAPRSRVRTTTRGDWVLVDQVSIQRAPSSLTVTACQPGSTVRRRGRATGCRASSGTT